MLRGVLTLVALTAAVGPSAAEELNVEAARAFVVGKLFSYNCFEGTRGAGRIYADGSVAGTVQFGGNGPVRYVALPAGTVRADGGSVCASVRGLPFEPCFHVDKTDPQSFRGSLSGLRFAYCDFTRRSYRPLELRGAVGAQSPLAIHAAAMAGASEGD
jgi:hypothetical protein